MSLMQLLFSFEGRIPRSTYWLHILAYLGIAFLTAALDNVLDPTSETAGYGIVTGLLGLLTFYTGLAVSVKRAHDRGHSGWFVMVALIPLVGPIWLIADLGIIRGTVGPNKYGPDPAESEYFVGA